MHTAQGIARLRPLLFPAAVVLAVTAALLSADGSAPRYAVVQAVQFVVFAAATPALLVLGRPARLTVVRGPASVSVEPAVRVAASLLPYLALVVVWRVPAVVAAVTKSGALTAVELVTLVAAGCALWAQLTAARNPLPHLLRAAMAAVAMWAIWAIAYVTGMSVTGLTHSQPGADGQQLAVALMWVVPAICYVPVVFVAMMAWLGDRDDPAGRASPIAADRASPIAAGPAWPDLGGPLPPPRGWR